jgi:DNA-directed RNA polymerase subunit RPC12/RpoP
MFHAGRMADRRVRMIYQFRSLRQHAELHCRGCGWRVILPPDAVERLFPPLLGIEEAAKRLRCRHCRRRNATMRALAAREYHG